MTVCQLTNHPDFISFQRSKYVRQSVESDWSSVFRLESVHHHNSLYMDTKTRFGNDFDTLPAYFIMNWGKFLAENWFICKVIWTRILIIQKCCCWSLVYWDWPNSASLYSRSICLQDAVFEDYRFDKLWYLKCRCRVCPKNADDQRLNYKGILQVEILKWIIEIYHY